MDEDSLSRDCEPFFESDGEEESTDGKSLIFFAEDNYCMCAQFHVCSSSTFIFTCFRLTERGCSSTVAQHGYGSCWVLGPSCPPHGSGPLAARICACVGLQRQQSWSGRQQQWRAGEHILFNRRTELLVCMQRSKCCEVSRLTQRFSTQNINIQFNLA